MSSFQIFTSAELASLRQAGKILAACLEEVASRVTPGITTGELDQIAEDFIRSHDGASPAFKGYQNYPSTLCTSVNEQCVHGLPGPRVLDEGDIVSLDCGVLVDGLYTDACITVGVGVITTEHQLFLDVTADALAKACAIVKPGTRIGDISSVIQKTVEAAGYKPVRGLTGHGLGYTLHQFPDVPNAGKAGTGPALPVGTIIAIEPITSMGGPDIADAEDGWTIQTKDGSLSAHFEHTVLVTENGQEILA
ncbi:MAG: type I methionyl aminopeptidase [Candidatus Peregrinibacteria bacterium]|nr:type I methionyl aminopeptidase [Candidatus Peregrinibacteria bacterium]